jgi:hypothetical protein
MTILLFQLLLYPNMPVYPAGQEREVTVLQTGQIPYAWEVLTTNFVKPEKEKLVVYELLVRILMRTEPIKI